MNRSCLLRLPLLLFAAALTACATTGSPLTGTTVSPPADHVSLRKVAPPPGLDGEPLEPLKGAAKVTANLALAEVAKRVSLPDYLKNAETSPPTSPPTSPLTEPTTRPLSDTASQVQLKAELAYARSRAAWLDGKRMEGLDQMQKALRLAPDQPAILAALGRMWVQAGNQIRGEDYLKRAAARDPHHLPTLILLGRFALDHRNWHQATAIFLAALGDLKDQSQIDPAIAPLLHYDLGVALRHAGYLLAAVKQYEAYIKAPRDFIRPTGFGEQLLYTDQQQGDLWQVIGDLCNQLDHPADALYAYHQASKLGVASPDDLLKARIFTQLRLNQLGMAESLVIGQLRQKHHSDDALSMISYVTRNGVPAAPFASQLETVYRDQNRSATLAIAIAHLLTRDKAARFLRDHLQAKPNDYAVFKALICDELLPRDAKATVSQLQTAAKVTARQVAADPGNAQDALQLLVTRVSGPDALITAIDKMPPQRRQSASIQTILGKAFSLANDLDAAVNAYHAAIKADAKLKEARVQLAVILINRNQFDQALTLLKPLDDSRDPRVVHLRVQALRLSGENDQAVKLLDRLIKAHGQQVKLVLQKAQLQIQLHETEQAAQTLRDAINAHPTDQKLYAALFKLYDSDAYQGDPVHGYERLMQQMLRNIPESRIAKLKLAELHAVRGEDDQAKDLLNDLLSQNGADGDALFMLAQIDEKNNHHGLAVTLFKRAVENYPQSKDVLTAARKFYAATQDADHYLAVSQKLLALEPAGAKRDLAAARLYLEVGKTKEAITQLRHTLKGGPGELADPEPVVNLLWQALVKAGKPDEAAREVKSAIARYPKTQARLTYQLAMLYQVIGKQATSEAVLLKLVKAHPKDDRAANALGYTWADAGKNLQQAHDLIARALKAKPTEPAYLDSMGWVLYKMGQFEQAAPFFRKAIEQPAGEDPVIMDHLGDALCRAGKVDEAFTVWRKAFNLYHKHSPDSSDNEANDLGQQLLAKIKASRRHDAIKDIPYLPPVGSK